MGVRSDYQKALSECRKIYNCALKSGDLSYVEKIFKQLLAENRVLRVLYDTLISTAIAHDTVYYGVLAEMLNARLTELGEELVPTRGSQLGKQLGCLLGTINLYELSQNRPLLSAVVVNKESNQSGLGFDNLLKEWNLNTTHSQELAKTYSYWDKWQQT